MNKLGNINYKLSKIRNYTNRFLTFSTVALLLIFVLTSCELFRKPRREEPKPKTEQPKEKEPVVEKKPEKKEEPKVKPEKPLRREADSLDRIYPVTMKERYNIALMLPFYLHVKEPSRTQKNHSSVAQDFYKGFLIGADTLKNCGVNLNIHVLDREGDIWKMQRLQDSLRMLDIDLVMGPLLENPVKGMAIFTGDNKINMVSPTAVVDSCFNKTYLLESNPGPEAYGTTAAELIKNRFQGYKVFLMNENVTEANPIAKAFVAGNPNDSLKVVDFFGKGASHYEPDSFFAEKNVFFIPSRSEVFTSALLSKLRIVQKDITVIGIYPWLYFKSFDGDLWERFNMHILTPFNVDYKNADVKSFVESYRNRYKEEPSEWSFRGYDEIVVYGRLMKQYGKYFQRQLIGSNRTIDEIQLLHSPYRFEKLPECNTGFRNRFVHVLEFKEYQLRKESE